MFLSDISIKRPIMITMFLMVFVIFGGIAYVGLSLDLTPQTDIPYVTITTIYAGGGPQEIETQITKKIEDKVAAINGLDKMTSYSLEGVSLIQLEFELGRDANIVLQETKDKVDAILNDLPADAELPLVEKIEVGSDPILDIILEGNENMSSVELYEFADKELKDRFTQVNGVAKVDLTGGREREIKVQLDNRVLFQNSISLTDLSQILASQNFELPGGSFKKRNQEISAKMKGKYTSLDELREVEIPTSYGKKKLGNIAKIIDSGEEVKERSIYFNNVENLQKDNIVLLSLVKSKDGNAVNIADEVKKQLPKIQEDLPDGMHLTMIDATSTFIRDSFEDTMMNIVLGIVLTSLILLFFLHDLRATIIIALSMPASIISTFMLMQIAGFTLNTLSLMGITSAVGVLVANSIVVLENIFRHKTLGENKVDAASIGTSEVTMAVLASTLTNIAVYLPIANMSSIVGQFFVEFAMTTTFATIFSLITSFTLTPMLASLILPESKEKKNPFGEKLESIFTSWEKIYRNILSKVLATKFRGVMILFASVLILFSSFYIAGFIGFEFNPLMDQGDISIKVELPQGYNLDQTGKMVDIITDKVRKHKEVKHILTKLGKINDMDVGANLAIMKVKLVDNDKRELSSSEMEALLIRDLSDVPNAIIRVAAQNPIGSGQDPVQFELIGYDTEKLEEIKTEIVDNIKDVEGLSNLNTSSRAGKPEISLTPDRVKIADAGITVYQLALTLRTAMEGLVSTTFSEEGEQYDIRLELTDESIDTPEEVENLTVVTPAGVYRMSQLADVKFAEGYNKIVHKDKLKAISFSANIIHGYVLGNIMNEINQRLEKIDLPNGYKVSWSGESERMQEMIADFLFAFILAVVLTYMLLAAILESFKQPLLILGTIPLALIGVFYGLYFTGVSLGLTALMAVIMLIGIVVNNAILIMDYTNILIKRGMSVKDALIEASPTKLKPILMSSIAIILGMLPMAMGIGAAGAEMRQPMGVVSIGGLVASMFLTLLVIPVLFQLFIKDKAVKEG